MNISFAKNMLDPITNTVVCLKATIDGQDCFIPLDPANIHYAEILRQVEAGELTIQGAE